MTETHRPSPNVRATLGPGRTIGILGGGQLGRMMALEARRMGYRIVVLDPLPGAPAAQVADDQVVAAYTDVEAAKRFASMCDVVAYEFEDVDDDVVAAIESLVPVPQGSALLRLTRHRLREKQALVDAGVPVADFVPVRTRDDLEDAAEQLGRPFLLKTTTGGYDGKGQWRIEVDTPIDELWRELPVAQMNEDIPFIAERKIDFALEASVVVGRSQTGELRCFPMAENLHRSGILRTSLCPARVPDQVRAHAEKIAVQVAEKLGLVGLLGVEMFVLHDGSILVNELAPRPHNSGHYTQDACVTSQFEQMVRIVCGMPLGDTRLLSPVVMGNILGEDLDVVVSSVHQWPECAKLHLYGKAEARPGRKMGHVNVVAPSLDEALQTLETIGLKAEGGSQT